MFNYYEERKAQGCFKVVCDKFVTSDAGTGCVHCSPGYGADDYAVCLRYKMIDPKDPGVSVDERGCFLPKVSDFKGLYIKDADKLIVKDLRGRNRLLKESQVKHSYPYCYRGGTP